ncbi:MAG: response regulator transcription factor [Candidatus Omnitrophica bacterium]|nr:response regulator transcription factor [Candidatus Omnitrophota bacterium]
MKRTHILICDDEPGIRESLMIILGKAHTLSYAHNGEEALAFLRREKLDLLIMDIKMPKMNGLDTLREVRKIKPDLKVLMVSGYEASDVVSEAINAGADDYLPKPFTQTQVQAKVGALLGEV